MLSLRPALQDKVCLSLVLQLTDLAYQSGGQDVLPRDEEAGRS